MKSLKKILPITIIIVLLAIAAVYLVIERSDTSEFFVPEDAVLDFTTLCTFGDENYINTKIDLQMLDEKAVIFLPANISPQSVTLFSSLPDSCIKVLGNAGEEYFINGKPLDLTKLCDGEEYALNFIAKWQSGKTQTFTLSLYFSENVPALYLVSENEQEEGRVWVESSADKSNKAKGEMLLQNADGSLVHEGALTQIKGRGNSTWGQIKKPYQIKTEEKVDLLQTENKDNKSKTWVLLANFFDPSLMRNSLALNLGLDMGMSAGIESTHVDLYYDGEYRGSYTLSEKSELGSGRVDIEDLDDLNEEANEGTDIEELEIKIGTTANGAEFTYCDTMLSPENITGGYLIELDYEVRAKEEISYFKTTRGQFVTVKSPEYASYEEMDYIATLYQNFEDAVYNGGIHPTTQKSYSDYVDTESLAAYFLMSDFSKEKDAFFSSMYFHKDKDTQKLTFGPLWDYDLSFGKAPYDKGEDDTPYGPSSYVSELATKLISIDDFYNTVKDLYNTKLLPLIQNVFSAQEAAEGYYISPYSEEYERIYASAKNNELLWPSEKSFEEEAQNFYNFVCERAKELKNIYSSQTYPTTQE